MRPRSFRVVLVWLTVLAGSLSVLCPAPAGATASSSVPPTSTTIPLDETQRPVTRIIPLPNSGHKPNTPGEGGGFLQVSLFFFICGAIVLLGVLAYFDSRRKRRRQAELAGQPAG